MYTHAFILSAGMGSRLRPYTDTAPKPMVPVAGKPIIDHIIDKLVDAGVTHVTVNTHYLGDIIKNHLKDRNDIQIIISEEKDLLETGGGLKHGLPTVTSDPFFIINGDAFWVEEGNIFKKLYEQWQPDNCDILLALQPVEKMVLTKGVGDYNITSDGKAVRMKDQSGSHMFAGIRLCKKSVFDNSPDGFFSFLTMMDRAQDNDRLSAIEFEGDWHHISTPEELDRVNEALK